MLNIEHLKVHNPSVGQTLNITLKIASGGVYALTGVGACGKSTLLRALASKLPDGFSATSSSLIIPERVIYLPQAEHKYVRFRSGLERNEPQFLKSLQSISDAQSLIMIDEVVPTQQWLDQLHEIKNKHQKHIVLIATHNLALIKEVADEVILLKEGNVYLQSTKTSFFENGNKDCYIENLLKLGF